MELSPKGLEPLWKIQFSARNRSRSSKSMTGIKVPDGSGASFPEQMLMVNKEAQQNRTRTVSPAAIPSKANYRVKSKKHL